MDLVIIVGGIGSLANALAVCILIWQARIMTRAFKADHERRRKQSTIEYVNVIRERYRPINNSLANKFGGNHVINLSEIGPSDKSDIIELLSVVEHLAVGVNVKVYDIEVIEKMAGTYFLRMYRRLEPYIVNARNNNKKAYTEFESMKSKIELLRAPAADLRGVMEYS